MCPTCIDAGTNHLTDLSLSDARHSRGSHQLRAIFAIYIFHSPESSPIAECSNITRKSEQKDNVSNQQGFFSKILAQQDFCCTSTSNANRTCIRVMFQGNGSLRRVPFIIYPFLSADFICEERAMTRDQLYFSSSDVSVYDINMHIQLTTACVLAINMASC